MMKILLRVSMLLLVACGPASAKENSDTYKPVIRPFTPDNHFEDPDWFNWGGSIIQGEGEHYYLFYSRWPRQYGFLSWLTHSEIAVATSKTPSGPWQYKYTALTGRKGNHWDAVTAHNPKIKRFGDQYYLYYSSTRSSLTEQELQETAKGGYRHKNWKPLRNNQRAGVAVSNKLSGPWHRTDNPIVTPAPPVYTITVNPAVTQMPDGRFLMMIKGDKFPRSGSPRIQAIALSDTPTGPYQIQPKPAIHDFDTEDASIWYDRARKRYYANFHAHTYFGMITSTDGITWNKARYNSFSPKEFQAADGSVFTAERMERPSVFTNTNGIPQVFISSYRKGNTTGIFTIPMDADHPEQNPKKGVAP